MTQDDFIVLNRPPRHRTRNQLILVVNLLLGPFMNLIFLKFREIRQRQLFYERFTLILFLIFSFFPAILYFDRAHVGDTWARYRCWVPCPPRAGQFEHKHTLWWLTRPARKLTPAQSHAELFATRNLFREELGLVRSCLSRAFPFWQNFNFGTLNFNHDAYWKPKCHLTKNLPLKFLGNQK